MANKNSKEKLGGEASAPELDLVGYKKPPKKNQFKKGESGNPKGRPKKLKTLNQALLDALHKPKTVIANGKPIRMAGVELLANKLLAAALDLKKPAITQVISMIEVAEAEQATAAAEAAKQAIWNQPFSWSEEEEKLYAELKALDQQRKEENGDEH